MKQKIKNYFLRNIVKVIIPEDIIREIKGNLYLGKDIITEEEKRSLNAEAKAIQSMRLWSIINESIKQLCFERGWRDSSTIEHLNTAKSMYSVLDVQNSIVDRLAGVL